MSADGEPVSLAIVHFKPTLGDVAGNVRALEQLVGEALTAGAKIVVAPELATTGFCVEREQIVDGGLGMAEPFDALQSLREAARAHEAVVVLGVAELERDTQRVYNSAVCFLPDGSHRVQRKRGKSGSWCERGDTPLHTVPTRYGQLGVVICSDTYLMDACRLLALGGARLLLCPANWWAGGAAQLALWSTRAHENGVHLVVANRYGVEHDRRPDAPAPPYNVYDMNDACSAVFAPDGRLLLCHRVADAHSNAVLLHTVQPARDARPWSLHARRPAVFSAALRLPYYRPDLGSSPPPDLPQPPAPALQLAVVASPSAAGSSPLLRQLLNGSDPIDVLLLPPLALDHADTDHWRAGLQQLVNERRVQLAVTAVAGRGLLLAAADQPLRLHAADADAEPCLVDVAGARIGVLFDRDVLLPELPMALARRGCDVLLVCSALDRWPAAAELDAWSEQNLVDLCQTATNNGVHVAASDCRGFGCVAQVYADQPRRLDAGTPFVQLPLDVAAVRSKYLNAYFDFDLDVLAPK